jgi:protein-L-isoaspartate(D-aspartate) O-methyltransferase
VEAALLAVPRHLFVPYTTLEEAYANISLPLKRDKHGSVISSASQPSMIAQMLEQLELQPGHNVLEIGAASGYNAALIQHIVGQNGRVTSVEIDTDIAEIAQDGLQRAQMGHVLVVLGDGAHGYAPRASYDRIISTVGAWDIPEPWTRQLKPNGILVTPLWMEAFQVSAALKWRQNNLFSADNRPCWFVLMRGTDAGPNLTVHVRSSSLKLTSSAVDEIDGAAVHALLSDDATINNLDEVLSYGELIGGLLPYLVLNPPPDIAVSAFSIADHQKPYGIEGMGFALISKASACFVPSHWRGATHCFGAADAFMTLRESLASWIAVGKPCMDKLRVNLTPKGTELIKPNVLAGLERVFPRRYHDLHVWMESEASS